MRRCSREKRAGWTLLEMSAVLPLTALVLSTSVVLLTTLFRSQQSLRNDLQQQSALARLGMQMRTDAHGAMSAKCDSPQSCDFALEGDETIHYELKETALHRELRKGNAVLERETYPLARSQATFSLDESRELPLVRLSIQGEAESRKYASASRSALVEAAVGTFHSQRGRRAGP